MVRPSFSVSQATTVSATVEAIDHETRVVTVRKADDEAVTFTVSEEARNLGQVAIGDVLVVEHVTTFSVQVMANDGAEAMEGAMSAVARTDEGRVPGGFIIDAAVVTATVEDINIEANTFRLKFVDGAVYEYVAQNPENLKHSKVGDLVVLTTTESVAVLVEHQSE